MNDHYYTGPRAGGYYDRISNQIDRLVHNKTIVLQPRHPLFPEEYDEFDEPGKRRAFRFVSYHVNSNQKYATVHISLYTNLDNVPELRVEQCGTMTSTQSLGERIQFPFDNPIVFDNLEKAFTKWLEIMVEAPYETREQRFNQYLHEHHKNNVSKLRTFEIMMKRDPSARFPPEIIDSIVKNGKTY